MMLAHQRPSLAHYSPFSSSRVAKICHAVFLKELGGTGGIIPPGGVRSRAPLAQLMIKAN